MSVIFISSTPLLFHRLVCTNPVDITWCVESKNLNKALCFFFFLFFFTRRPYYFHVHGWKSYYKGVQLLKKRKEKKKWHFIPTICPRCLSRQVINTAQYSRWHYKCVASPWDENETGLHQVLLIRRAGGRGGVGVKLNHFWRSVHSSRSNNNCGRWLNRVCMKGLVKWTQSFKLDRSHPSEWRFQ